MYAAGMFLEPRFVPSCTPELLKACGELAGKYGLPVQSHLSENVSEIEWVAHCPTSNFNLSSGIAPVRSFLDEGLRVGLGSFEPGYEFDALVIDDDILHPEEYSLLHRLERYIYVGDDRQIVHRFCRGQEVPEPTEK